MNARLHGFVVSVALCFLSLAVSAAALTLPTPVPTDPQARAAAMQTLTAKSPESRKQEEWRKLAVLSLVTVAAGKPEDDAAVVSALETVAQARKKYPNDAELMAVEGSLMGLRARKPDLPSATAMTYARQGTRTMDRAVESDPMNLGARLQRGINALNSPAFVGRTEIAISDFSHILESVRDQKVPDLQAMVGFLLGEAYAKVGKADLAKEAWGKSARLEPNYWAGKAKEKLR